MQTKVRDRRRLRWVLSCVFAVTTVGGLVVSAPGAGAVGGPHSIAGTYRAFAPNFSGPVTLVLLPNHSVEGSLSSWTQNGTFVTIVAFGGPASPIVCVQHHQPPTCNYNDVSTGPKTPTGIASQQVPGSAGIYVGGALLLTSPFWAVRTGKA